MPKIIDVQERQVRVSEAAWRVLRRDGIAALSLRNIASEAGMPPSSLRYTFPTVESVRIHAADLVRERVQSRMARFEQKPRDRVWAEETLAELLPLDEDRRVEMEVYISLGTASLTEAALRPAYEAIQSSVRTVCAEALAALGNPDDEHAVAALHALLDGLAVHLVHQEAREPTAWARQSLSHFLEILTRSRS